MTKLALGLIASIALTASTHAAWATELIANGSFESNGGAGTDVFTDWTVQNQSSGGTGSFFVQTGTMSPEHGATVQAPPEGSFAAMTDAFSSGAHVLYQAFTVPAVVTSAVLSFEYYVRNQASAYYTPGVLDYTVVPNQEDRVDIITSSAGAFSTALADVVMNILQSSTSDPLTVPYTTSITNLTSLLQGYEGQTLVLRFGEVDNQGIYNFGVDSVSLIVNAASVPEPGPLGWFAVALTGLGALARRRRRLS